MTGIADILYVRFRIPDLDRQQRFLDDFGFLTERDNGTLLARGTDPNRFVYVAEQGEAAFLALGFEAVSAGDLERIAAIDEAEVRTCELPCGGNMVQLHDPDGLPVEIVHGVERPAPVPPPRRNPLNSGEHRSRFGQRFSFEKAPAAVKRLGHCVINVTDFRTSEAWYKERLGLLTSDEVYIGEEQEDNPLGAFMRCDRGAHYVDHHTLFLVGAGHLALNHAAFEVADWDTLMLGHDTLQQAGYDHRWGVGKHLVGSQVFDYWKDPHGFTMEHFTDSDLFNVDSGSHKVPVSGLRANIWGPDGHP